MQSVGDTEFSVVPFHADGNSSENLYRSEQKDKFKMLTRGKNTLALAHKMLDSNLPITTQE